MTTQRVHPSALVARILAERLAGCAPSDELRAIVRAHGVDWERVVGHASSEYVLPAMAAALRDLDLIEALDEELGAFLDAVHAANAERNDALRAELAIAVDVLNRAGIEPVLLKGAIRLADGLYPDRGWRMLRDLDLLVPAGSLSRGLRALEAAGYAPCGPNNELQRAGGACQIDLHDEVFSGSTQLRLLRATTILNRSRRSAPGPGGAWIPSVEDQLVHLIGHGQIRHCGHAAGRISLRDRLEAAALVRWSRAAPDWPAVIEPFVAAGYRRPLQSFLLALQDGAWCAVPAPGRSDPLLALQQRRIAWQDRSRLLGYLGARAGWWVSEFNRQIKERDAGQPRVTKNFKRLLSERGAMRRMARAFWERYQDFAHALPYLGWFTVW